MIHIFSNNYLPSKPIEEEMKVFARRFTPKDKVLDIGCGNMPYAKYFNCTYVGSDPHPATPANIHANAWELPVADASFDGVILNQSLEHISETGKTINEIWRVLKPGGYVIITVPQTMKNHSVALPALDAPVKNFDSKKEKYWRIDYYRFTKYGLMYLFRNFKIINLKETTGYGGTICQLINYFFASLHMDPLFRPAYFVMNILGASTDYLIRSTAAIHPFSARFVDLIYNSLTINLILIVKKPRENIS